MAYYMDLPAPIRSFSLEKLDDTNRTFTSDTVEIEGPDEFRIFLADVLEHGGMVITRGDWVAELEESEEGREFLALLQAESVSEQLSERFLCPDEKMALFTSPMNIMQEYEFKKLRRKPGWPDDPALKRKYKKLDKKRVYIYYHPSFRYLESIREKHAEADGAEGTPQP